MRIEHKPYVGENYENGISGKKIAIVGYSHWSDGEFPDTEYWSDFTIKQVFSGKWSPNFFSSIRNNFGYSDHRSFWTRVLFFNYVPWMIGTGNERFASINEAEAVAAKARFLNVIDDYKPDIVFVFSLKTHIGELGLGFKPMPAPLAMFSDAKRNANGHETTIVRLRHPQGASAKELRAAIAFHMK